MDHDTTNKTPPTHNGTLSPLLKFDNNIFSPANRITGLSLAPALERPQRRESSTDPNFQKQNDNKSSLPPSGAMTPFE